LFLSGAAFPKKGAKKEGAVVPFGKTAPVPVFVYSFILMVIAMAS